MAIHVADLDVETVIHFDPRLLRGHAALDLVGFDTVTLARGVDGVNPLWIRARTPDGKELHVFVDEFESAITSVEG